MKYITDSRYLLTTSGFNGEVVIDIQKWEGKYNDMCLIRIEGVGAIAVLTDDLIEVGVRLAERRKSEK